MIRLYVMKVNYRIWDRKCTVACIYVHILHRMPCVLVSPLILVVPFILTRSFTPSTSCVTVFNTCRPRLSTVNANIIAMAREEWCPGLHFSLIRKRATHSLDSLHQCRRFRRPDRSYWASQLHPQMPVHRRSLAARRRMVQLTTLRLQAACHFLGKVLTRTLTSMYLSPLQQPTVLIVNQFTLFRAQATDQDDYFTEIGTTPALEKVESYESVSRTPLVDYARAPDCADDLGNTRLPSSLDGNHVSYSVHCTRSIFGGIDGQTLSRACSEFSCLYYWWNSSRQCRKSLA